MTLSYTEAGTSLFSLNASVSGCYASFGAYPHWCLGNMTSCATSGLTVAFWFKPLPLNISSDPVTILTNGGTTSCSDGFYVLRRYGDQFEVGVAQGKQRWRTTVRLQTVNSWVHLALAWSQGAGLRVRVDGLHWLAASSYENRSYVSDPELRAVEVGVDAYGDAVTSPCTFDLQRVDVADSDAAVVALSGDSGNKAKRARVYADCTYTVFILTVGTKQPFKKKSIHIYNRHP